MNGVIIEVVVDDAFTNSVVFIGVFNNRLLEVAVELEYLKKELVSFTL